MKRVALMILVLGAFASCAFAQYGQCTPNPAELCSQYHPTSILTGQCLGERCFEVNYGEWIKVVLGDDFLGDFPKMWFTWHEGPMILPTDGPVACQIREKQLRSSVNKTRVEIPDTSASCSVEGIVGNHHYYEYFASNPATRCLGWIECREDILP